MHSFVPACAVRVQQHGTGAKPSVPLAELGPNEGNEGRTRRESASSADFQREVQSEVEAALESLRQLGQEDVEQAVEVLSKHLKHLQAAVQAKEAELALKDRKIALHEDIARDFEKLKRDLQFKTSEYTKMKRRLLLAERLTTKAPLSYSKFFEGGNPFFRAQMAQFIYFDTSDLLRDHVNFLNSYYPLCSIDWLDTNIQEADAEAGAEEAQSPKRRKRRFPVTAEDAVVMWLFLLRTGCTWGRAAALFHTSVQTVRRCFHTMTVLHKELFQDEFFKLEEDALRAIIPEMMKTFREHEGVDTTVAHIIDGFERPMQKPQDDEAAVACWSQYKHNYTAKFLLGILSSGVFAMCLASF